MPVAAVPQYLGKDFSQASPGLRFGLYLPIWKGQPGAWAKDDDAAKDAWRQVVTLSPGDRERMKAVADRQVGLARGAANLLTLDAIATAPFTTGLGNEHPLENGFSFLNPYGLPYLPGSGIKGVLRQAARELASGEWGETHDWTAEKIHELNAESGGPIDLSVIDVLFGLEPTNGDNRHVRGALCFWDALPKIQGDNLAVEIMTPHQGHYYQQKNHRNGHMINPHDSGQPIPISFLTLPPGTGFCFNVQCDLPHLQRLAPDLAVDDRWKTLMTAAFEHAFTWLGFGAKTAVGYGAMRVDEEVVRQREKDRQAAAAASAEAARLAGLSSAMREIDAFEAKLRSRHEKSPNAKAKQFGEAFTEARTLANTARNAADWSADEKRAAADAIETWLPRVEQWKDIKDLRKRLQLNVLKQPPA